MPIYEFLCQECDTVFEAIKPVGTSHLECARCGNGAARVPSSFSARTVSKSKSAGAPGVRKERPRIALPDDVKRPDVDLGPPPPLPQRYVHQLKHHGHC